MTGHNRSVEVFWWLTFVLLLVVLGWAVARTLRLYRRSQGPDGEHQ